MADVAFVVVMIAFFGLASLCVSACERVVGGSAELAPALPPDVPQEVAA